MKSYKIIVLISTYFYSLLFSYASISKLIDFENFQIQLAQSPLLSAFAGIISYSIIILELFIAIILCIPKTRLVGLYSSLFLMISFSVYIYIILNYSDFIPCSCGGILEKLGWSEHLFFNIGCILLALLGIFLIEKSNQKKIIYTLISTTSCAIVASITIYVLFINSEYIIKKENNFTRRFPHHPIIENNEINLGVNSFYFAGINQNEVYLGNTTSPLMLISIDKDFKKIKKHSIKLEGKSPIFKSIQIAVNPPYFYIYDGTVPIIYRGKLGNPDAKIISYKDAYFNRLLVLDSTKFIIRAQSSKSKKLVLGILKLDQFPKLKLSDDLISKQKESTFDLDGNLITDNQHIYYISYYKNKILKADDELKKVEYHKTIDSTTKTNIKIVELKNGHQKMSVPPKKINEKGTVHKGILFNQSNLMGQYENKEQWSKTSIIDIYNTNNRKYWGSLYIQNRGNHKLNQMLVSDTYLYTLIGDQIVRYRLAQKIQEQFKTGETENLNKE